MDYNFFSIRNLWNFIDDGPAEVLGDGAVKEILPSGSPFPSQEIWWTDVSKTKKIVELTLTRDSNKNPSVEEWKIYDFGGSVIRTITDTISYSGVFETGRVRVIT